MNYMWDPEYSPITRVNILCVFVLIAFFFNKNGSFFSLSFGYYKLYNLGIIHDWIYVNHQTKVDHLNYCDLTKVDHVLSNHVLVVLDSLFMIQIILIHFWLDFEFK